MVSSKLETWSATTLPKMPIKIGAGAVRRAKFVALKLAEMVMP
jgi:hypothetical protein